MKNLIHQMKYVIIQFLPLLFFIAFEQSYSLRLLKSHPDILSLIMLYSVDITLFGFTVLCLNKYAFRRGSDKRIVFLFTNGRSIQINSIIITWAIAVMLVITLISLYIPIRLAIYTAVITHEDPTVFSKYLTETNVWLCLFRGIWISLLASLVAVDRERLEKVKRNNLQEKQLIEAKLHEATLYNEFLRSQIQSHFLFNTMSFIFRSANKVSFQLGELVLRTADIMEYSFKEVLPSGMVDLNAELAHIENYLEVRRITNDGDIYFDLELNRGSTHIPFVIPPSILITFIENVFQHGNLNRQDFPAIISINTTGNQLHLYTRNLIENNGTHKGHGIGMDNVLTRLNAFYKGRHTIEIQHTGSIYELNLRIEL